MKIDVSGLSPATTYYYRFDALGARSAVGRTRTLPAAGVAPRAHGAGLVRELSARLLQRLRPHRRARRRRRRAAPGRLHLRVRTGPLRRHRAGRRPAVDPPARDLGARRLPPPLRALPHRSRPAGGAPPASVHRRVGRPRDRQQHLARRRREPPAGRGRLHRAPRRRLPGLPRMAAGARHRLGAPAAHLPLVRRRRSRRPGDARHPAGRSRRAGRAHQRARHRGPAAHDPRPGAGAVARRRAARVGARRRALADPRPAGDVRAADARTTLPAATPIRGTAIALSRSHVYDMVERHQVPNLVVLTGDVHSAWAYDLPRQIDRSLRPGDAAAARSASRSSARRCRRRARSRGPRARRGWPRPRRRGRT